MRCCFLLPFPLKSTARTTTSRAHTNRSCSSASGWSYDPPPHKSVDWSFTIFGFLRETRARCLCPAPRPRRRSPRCRRRSFFAQLDSRRRLYRRFRRAATDAPAAPPLRSFTPTLLTTPPALRLSSRRTSRRSQSTLPTTLPTTLLLTTLAQSSLPTTLFALGTRRALRSRPLLATVARACFSRSASAQVHASPLRARAFSLEQRANFFFLTSLLSPVSPVGCLSVS